MPEGLSSAEIAKEIDEYSRKPHAHAKGSEAPRHAGLGVLQRHRERLHRARLKLLQLDRKRLRPGYAPAVHASLALHPLVPVDREATQREVAATLVIDRCTSSRIARTTPASERCSSAPQCKGADVETAVQDDHIVPRTLAFWAANSSSVSTP